MMKHYTTILLACALTVGVGLLTSMSFAQADRWQALRDDPTINNGLIVIAVGRQIHNSCDDVNARLLRALGFAESLVSHAQTLGFTRAEVNEFIDDRTEQQRYRHIASQYFAERGAEPGDGAGVCQVGRDEIAAGSAIGRLLR
jgi:hypothetical protein